ncbi:MAG: L-aspartate oxidase, partial [Gemmatimonadetes bacterium]|nr:L-aspartate oxidase [Gemmatimonadota bacterium]
MPAVETLRTDVLVIGTGIGGLFFAIKAAPHGRVLVLTKKASADSNTNWAQGGIAAVTAPDDSVEQHVRDTLEAGDGLCSPEVVRAVVEAGPARVRELMELGVRFSTVPSPPDGVSAEGEPGAPAALSLAREGGHSRRRIVRAGDLTGREIERALLRSVGGLPWVELREHWLGVDLLLREGNGVSQCAGAVALDVREQRLVYVLADVTVLATGGCGQAYRYTTNPPIATGDGIAMAYRAGAVTANMEFMQFHPTALYPADEEPFLISEAVRGEGAVLRRRDGEPFMGRYHALRSLAPRDVVARAIDREMKDHGDEFVLLDLSPIPKETLLERFPNILAECQRRGYDPFGEPLPVVPAAHYMCGGIRTDLRGQSSIPRLLVVGEAGCTGLHGANRLASNSLLEAVVVGGNAAERAGELLQAGPRISHAPVIDPGGEDAAVEAMSATEGPYRRLRESIRRILWDEVGIVRREARLRRATQKIAAIHREFEQLAAGRAYSEGQNEIRNLLQVAALIIESALWRRESRGLHFTLDHPQRDPAFERDTLLVLRRVRDGAA